MDSKNMPLDVSADGIDNFSDVTMSHAPASLCATEGNY
jgi:hypothetical protein